MAATSPLPTVVHDGNRWYGEFIPTIIQFLGTRSMSPWRLCVRDLPTLQRIWAAVYGKTIPWIIEVNDRVYVSVTMSIRKWHDCISNAAICAFERFFQSSRKFADFAARCRFCQAILRDSRLFYETFDTPFKRGLFRSPFVRAALAQHMTAIRSAIHVPSIYSRNLPMHPWGAIGLSAAAVYRAALLFSTTQIRFIDNSVTGMQKSGAHSAWDDPLEFSETTYGAKAKQPPFQLLVLPSFHTSTPPIVFESHANGVVVVDNNPPLISRSQTRTVVPRVGRSQPVAGPSNVRGPVIVIDDDAEIIELSSDEEKPPTKKPRVVVRSADRKRENALKNAVQAALDGTQDVTAHLDPVPASADEHLKTIVAEKSDCPICLQKMWRPYILTQCGHTFCVSCLQEWFNTAYAEHIDEYPEYNPQQLISAAVRARFARTDIPPGIKRNLNLTVASLFYETRRPQFSCPSCREPVHAPPVENFALKDLIHTIADPAQGETPHEWSTRPLLVEVEPNEPFCGFFPFAKYM
ncbi:hypothetical protein LXA43DRAFT_1102274 [Ganoderma leucocontextum]|nr:hypothetical protein LXA43DRAFT_1102274 [Ganoderma leucocontextum]